MDEKYYIDITESKRSPTTGSIEEVCVWYCDIHILVGNQEIGRGAAEMQEHLRVATIAPGVGCTLSVFVTPQI